MSNLKESDLLRIAEGKWILRIDLYPSRTIANEDVEYIFGMPGSTSDQKDMNKELLLCGI
jgi:hypothetical protein